MYAIRSYYAPVANVIFPPLSAEFVVMVDTADVVTTGKAVEIVI